jgi:hypothetical protein
MSQLSFPVTAQGLTVDVRINLDSRSLQGFQARNQPVPASIPARGLIDTGTDVTAVAPAVLSQLGIPPHSKTTTQGIGGSLPVTLYEVTLFVLDASQPHLPWLVESDLLVMELPAALPVDVLIGLDVLLKLRLHLDGPGKLFLLDF